MQRAKASCGRCGSSCSINCPSTRIVGRVLRRSPHTRYHGTLRLLLQEHGLLLATSNPKPAASNEACRHQVQWMAVRKLTASYCTTPCSSLWVAHCRVHASIGPSPTYGKVVNTCKPPMLKKAQKLYITWSLGPKAFKCESLEPQGKGGHHHFQLVSQLLT